MYRRNATLKKWIILEQKFDDPILQILWSRKIPKNKQKDFLSPDYYTQLHDSAKLKNVGKAINRLVKALENKEKIGIFSDYDADGITSATLLFEALERLNIKPFLYIPLREDGYGINKKGIDYFNKNGVSLMFALDLGITGKSHIEYAKKRQIETIVIDHHIVQEKNKPGCIIINPKQSGDKYPFKDLSAGGLVYKFVTLLSKKYPQKISQNLLKYWLELVAISTVADIVPLVDENRVMVNFGLMILKNPKREGLIELYREASISSEKISTWTVAFQIAPRLNSPGRIKHALVSFNLLTEKVKKEAAVIAHDIEQSNRYRQEELEDSIAQAKEKILKNKLDKKNIIMVFDKKWKPGLVGLVAGRLMEEFSRPVIVLSQEGKMLRGSARSIEALHIVEAFAKTSKYIDKFGGHARAAGLSLELKNLDYLYSALLEYSDSKLKKDDLIPKLTVDKELKLSDVTFKLVDNLKKLEPFGFGNSKPLFILRSQKLQEIRLIGKEKKHIKFKLSDNVNGIYFQGVEHTVRPSSSDRVDLVCYIEENIWNGRKSIDLIVNDWRITK